MDDVRESWVSGAYLSGSYLHRMYLDKNALFSSINSSNDFRIVDDLLRKKISLLRRNEDELLTAYAAQYGDGSNVTPQGGLTLISLMLKGSDKALEGLNIAINGLFRDNDGSFDIRDSDNIDEIREAIVSRIDRQMNPNISKKSKQLGKLYEQLHETMIEGINSVLKDKDKMSKSMPAIKGFLHEEIVNSLYIYNILESVSQLDESQIQQFEEWCYDIGTLASFEGNKHATVHGVKSNRHASYDMSIKVKVDNKIREIPVQLKAKPKAKNTDIELHTKMELDNLISKTVKDTIQLKAVKTALINQHYWGSKAYKTKVRESAKANNYSGIDGNISSVHPTAIERFDESKTLDSLRPVIPIVERAVLYGLITGIDDKINTLLYVVTKPDGYEIMRSSKILSNLFGLDDESGENVHIKGIDALNTKGTFKYKDGTAVINDEIIQMYGEPGKPLYSQQEWFDMTNKAVEETYRKIRITVSLNYGQM